jgi:hypothetical protein
MAFKGSAGCYKGKNVKSDNDFLEPVGMTGFFIWICFLL